MFFKTFRQDLFISQVRRFEATAQENDIIALNMVIVSHLKSIKKGFFIKFSSNS